ncbi:MAG TPA: hypothetical protein PK011_06000 [Marinagarivorans sp.]|nr:hypothetical protein [Cellvibrionaceae bacterium]HMY38857.1 hypothetical protein [Marinagarivorans sp.]HNG58203.1 hypothetical protein [Cellvibrionaceae bacterium]
MRLKKCVMVLGLAAFLQSTTGCGLLLHPERQGSKGGNLDPVIVLLDGLGLFFFLVPGIVAFAVDVSTGCIYTGGGGGGGKRRHFSSIEQGQPINADELAGMKKIALNGPVTKASIEAALERELGQKVDITAANVQVQPILEPAKI